MTRITFDKVSIKGVRRWTEDGKKRQVTREFFQTVNPFNRNVDGTIKTRAQIMRELLAERKAWRSAPLPQQIPNKIQERL